MNVISTLKRVFQKSSNTINPSAWYALGFGKDSGHRQLNELYYGIVYSCIDAIASAVASTTPQLYVNTGDDSPDEVLDDPILAPLKRANRFQTGSDVLYTVSSHIDTYGMSYLWPKRNLKGYPIELWALDPSKVKQIKSETDFMLGYVYQSGTYRMPFNVDELVPIYRPHPFNQYAGVSTIEMARLEAEADLNAQEYNKSFFTRGAKPSGILTTEEEMSEAVWERVKKQWAENNESKDSWRKTMVLEQGLKYQQLSLNQKDMDFIEQRKLSRDDIMAIFKVPKTILAITDGVNYANAEAGEYVFAKYTKLTRLNLIYEKLNHFYLPLFPNSQNKFLSFENPVPEDVEKIVNARMKEVHLIKTVNEARAEANLPGIGPDGDKLYTPINLIEIGVGAITEPESADDGGDDDAQNPPEKGFTLEKGMEAVIKSKSRERRYLQASNRYLAQREKQMAPAMRQLYVDLIRAVRKAPIKKAGEESPELILEMIMPNLNEFKSLSTSVIMRYDTDTFREGLQNVSNILELPVNFDLVHSGAVSYLKNRANDTATSLRDSMLNKARQVIAEKLEEPKFTLKKAKDEVLKIFEDEASWRSERIARTETQTAYNEASYRSYSESGMVGDVKWIVSKAPCEVCKQNQGKVVKLGDAFPSGHSHPIVHPNCTCGLVPYFGV